MRQRLVATYAAISKSPRGVSGRRRACILVPVYHRATYPVKSLVSGA
jgi:hypothetical protein